MPYTNIDAGSEAFVTSLTLYNSIKAAAKVNVPGANALAEELGERFAQPSAPDSPPPDPAP